MRQPLKDKLQNAINRALLPENDVGALIVGGRRRNRKKKEKKEKKTKNKNNAAKNKKNAKKTEGKTKKIAGVVIYKDDSGHESDPLIEDETEDWRDNQELVPGDDTENVDPNKMPFGLFKKSKKDKKEKKEKKKDKDETKDIAKTQEENQQLAPQSEQDVQPQQFKPGTTLAAMAATVPKKPEPVREPAHDEEAPDGGFVPDPSNNVVVSNDTQISQKAVQEKTDPEKPVDKDETELKKLQVKDGVKSENSPLINKDAEAKESKLQDQQPGMLCCTIL